MQEIDRGITTLEISRKGTKPIEKLLAESINQVEYIDSWIGTVDNIRSTLGPFHRLEGYRRYYPMVVVNSLSSLYREYNAAFASLMKANQEREYEYGPIFNGNGNSASIPFVQIDMVGLPDKFLADVESYREEEVTELLRHKIFEIENSLAMYPLLEGIFSYDGYDSEYKMCFRKHLDNMRQKYGKPIALLALTNEKLASMRATEFGKTDGEILTDEEVYANSGFDTLMGPEDFVSYLNQSGGKCGYLLYARSSYPLGMIKHPDQKRYPEILWDPEIRSIIKANAITPNIDNPPFSKRADKKGVFDTRQKGMVNDTKAYMEPMGMGTNVFHIEDYNDVEEQYVQQGVSMMRLKPMYGSYGCYGHMRAPVGEVDLTLLAKNIHARGPYVVQPEVTVPAVIVEGNEYVYIDRVFMAYSENNPRILTVVRNLLPVYSEDADQGRIHGGSDALYGEVLPEYD